MKKFKKLLALLLSLAMVLAMFGCHAEDEEDEKDTKEPNVKAFLSKTEDLLDELIEAIEVGDREAIEKLYEELDDLEDEYRDILEELEDKDKDKADEFEEDFEKLIEKFEKKTSYHDDEQSTETTEPIEEQEKEIATYTVTVTTAGGMAMEDLDICVYADNTLTDLVQFGRTDANGSVTLSMPAKEGYAVTISGAPKGYKLEASYPLIGTSVNIKLSSAVITYEQLDNVGSLKLGDVMYDFTYTLPDGTTKKLSEVLAEKEMVVLNFWFAACGPCATEFPYMEQAYQIYKDNAAVIALSCIDDNAAVGEYQSDMGISFDMAACNPMIPGKFSIMAYPTTIVIDRYGVICMIEVGAIINLQPFISVFEHFIGEDYEQKLLTNGVADVYMLTE